MYWTTVGPFGQSKQKAQIVFSEATLENDDSEKDFQGQIGKISWTWAPGAMLWQYGLVETVFVKKSGE